MAKILIIESNLDLQDFLSFFIKMQGYKVKAVSLETEVQESIENFKPDLILLDVVYSGIDGREICRKIKKLNKDLLIILLSTDSKYLQNYEECLADSAIEKPFNNEIILKTIKLLLHKKKHKKIGLIYTIVKIITS